MNTVFLRLLQILEGILDEEKESLPSKEIVYDENVAELPEPHLHGTEVATETHAIDTAMQRRWGKLEGKVVINHKSCS